MIDWQHIRGRTLAVLATGALVITAVSACGGDDGPSGSGKRLNVEKFRQQVRPIGEHGTVCPLPYDVAAAARKVHIDGTVTPGEPAASGAEGWSDDEAAARDPQSNLTPVQRVNGVALTCSYRVGADKIDVGTYGARRGFPLNIALPVIQRDSNARSAVLGPFADDIGTGEPQRVIPVGDGHVAAVRLRVTGPGSAAMYVSSETLTPERVADLAGALAGQLD
ncbi:hypothetical protein [Embleya hyalina]|uniref:DUF5642 domain-containing protein n=1 Tax=Embleya hyalina TaxID=516124 RepID=A0A401YXR1_9ACTN|nr:hypothetical protein [Embleya hyalina]GCD99305.1 hypothetical protein EHYA_07019 [Embleya hyalina]